MFASSPSLLGWGFTIYPLTLFGGCKIGQNAKFLLTLHYKNGHQGSNPGGHSFVFLNVSINKESVFFS
jgi:hypothetical protein